MLDKEEVQAWKAHPLTGKMLNHLRQVQQERERLLSRGVAISLESVERTAQATCRQVGFLEGLDYVLNLGNE